MANGKITYNVSGSSATYTFAVNYSYGHAPGYLDLHSRKRALNGDVFQSVGPAKRTWSLDFSGAPLAQKEAFEAAFASGEAIDLYLDADLALTAEVIFASPPETESEAMFGIGGLHTWSISLEFEET